MNDVVPATFDMKALEDDSHGNGVRFWYAHKLQRDLGYQTWSSFQNVILKAQGACARIGIDSAEAFMPATVEIDGKEIKTYRLTRFAIFLITMNADSNKPQVAQAKAVLAAVADELAQQNIGAGALARLETREDLKIAENVMEEAAARSGLDSKKFGIFKDAGFRGMYNMSLKQLKVRKGVDAKSTLYDFMGLEEMAGNLFRVTQTAARVKNQNAAGLDQLAATATQVGGEVRAMMIKNSGVTPESLPIECDVKKLPTQLKKVKRQMENQSLTGESTKPKKSGKPRKSPRAESQ